MVEKNVDSGLYQAVGEILETEGRFQSSSWRSEDRLRSVVRDMPAMMVAYDDEGRIVVWNRESERVTGYSASEIVGNPDAIKLLLPDESYRDRVISEWFTRRHDYRDWEWEIVCKDGSVKTVSWSNISWQFPILGWAAWSIGLDVTERERVEAELKRRLEEQETLFAISQLIASDLRLAKVTQLVAEHMAHLVGAAGCRILDWDPEAGVLTTRAEYVRPDQRLPRHLSGDAAMGSEASGHPEVISAIRDRQPRVVSIADTGVGAGGRTRAPHAGRMNAWRCLAIVPIVARDRVIGAAQVFQTALDPSFTDHDLRLLQTLASQVAVAIDNARLFSTVQANETALRNISLRLLSVQEQERRHIAQELHDELGQLLTAIKINIELAQRKLAGGAVSVQRRLDEASKLTDDVLTSVRTMTVELRPALLDEMGIVPALRWYLKRFAQRTGVHVHFEAEELAVRLGPEIETTIYRVVQEALTNVARHAQANHVKVDLVHLNAKIVALIQDDGCGFDVEAWTERRDEHQTLGLAGIQERVALLGGKATLFSQPGKGTRIEIELPAHPKQGGGT